MNSARIFLVGDDNTGWIPMVETPYEQELVLQQALADYPDLLPGDQINPEAPRRWLLVRRELGIPGAAGGGSVWSLDHLFLDQDGIPTFVECKRSGDTRGRREVVAQMLDYAANGTEYWPIDRLRQAAAETARSQGKDLDEQIQHLIGADEATDLDSYWERVESNLRDGRIRLIFVADAVPRELRRLVEFLNSKMNDVEVLAVEVKQFLGHGQRAMVPRVIGLTELARATKPGGVREKLTREAYLARCAPETVSFFADMVDAAEARRHTIYWGERGFSVRLFLPDEDRLASFAYGYPPDIFEFYFGQIPLAEADAAALRRELMSRGIFQEAGQKTLRAQVSAATERQLRDTYAFILDKMDEITSNSATSGAP